MRLLVSTYTYPEYLSSFYFSRSGLSERSYQSQYDELMLDRFAWSDVWHRSLNGKNGYEVQKVVVNSEHLQKKWAEEHNVSFNEASWMEDVFFAQIDMFKPDVLFVHDGTFLTPERLAYIKKMFPFIKLIIGYDGIGMNDVHKFNQCDIVISCLEDTAEYYKLNSGGKIKGYYFPLAFDASVNDLIKKPDLEKEAIPFSFIGSLIRGSGYHNKRIEDIAELALKTNIKIFSKGFNEPYEPYRYLQRQRLFNLQFKEFFEVYLIGRKLNKPVFGLEMYEVLSKSKITFNSHIDAAGKAANMRLFEATGVGACLLTDHKKNLDRFFDVDREVVTYKSISECISKVKYLLNNEKERKKIAEAGQKRTLREHSLEKRIQEFCEYINSNKH